MNENLNKKLAYLRYVKTNFPLVYTRAIRESRVPAGLSGLGVTVEEMLTEQNAFAEPTAASGSWLDSFRAFSDTLVQGVQQYLPVYAGVKQNELLLKINAERLKNGLPPINPSDLSPQVNVGISKEVQYIAFAILGIGALYLFTRKR